MFSYVCAVISVGSLVSIAASWGSLLLYYLAYWQCEWRYEAGFEWNAWFSLCAWYCRLPSEVTVVFAIMGFLLGWRAVKSLKRREAVG